MNIINGLQALNIRDDSEAKYHASILFILTFCYREMKMEEEIIKAESWTINEI